MDAYADALGIVADKPRKAASGEAQMRSEVQGDMGANPADLDREIAAVTADLQKPLDASSKGLLQTHLADLHQQKARIAPAPPAPPAEPKADPYAAALGIGEEPAPAAVTQATRAAPAPRSTAIVSPEADLTASIGSGMVAPVVAGIHGAGRGLWELLRTGDKDKAVNAGVDAIHSTQDALTYRPRTEQGQQMVEAFGSNLNPVNWIPRATSWLGEKGGDFLAEHGAPGAGAVVSGVGAAAPVAIGAALPKVVPAGVRRISDLLNPQEVARVEPTMATPKPRYRLGPDGQPVMLDQPLPQPGSGGAAVAVPAAPAAVATTRPTLAQASPELQQVVQQKQASGKPINQQVLDRHLEADTLPVKVKLTEGQATLDPDLISTEMNGRGKAKPTVSPDFYNQQGKALAQNLDHVRETAAPNATGTNHAEHGQVLVDEYKAADASSRADIKAKYKALEQANGGQLPLSGQDFVTAADAALANSNKGYFLPKEVKSLMDEYRSGGKMTFDNFENLRTILAAEGRKAARAGDGNAEAAIGHVRESLESLPMSGESANIKPLADAARQAAKARFDKIKADPAYKAVVNDDVPHGEPSPLADKFVQNYIVNGKGAHVKQMKANIGGSTLANETISRASLDYLADMAKADKETGKFLADRYNAGVRQLGPKMGDIFDPKTKQTVEQIGRVSKYTSAQPKGSYVNNSNTFVGAAADATKNVAEGVANNAAFGVPIGTFVRKGLQHRAESKAAKRSTAPGAGIDSLE
jgi:hypothetical protein